MTKGILYIYLDEGGYTLKRRLLQDAAYLSNNGWKIDIACLKDSDLWSESISSSINLKELHLSRTRLNTRRVARQVKARFFEQNYTIIHYFGLHELKGIATAMLKNLEIPFYLTYSGSISKKLPTLFMRRAISRIDRVFVLNDIMEKKMIRYLDVKKNKVHNLGMGIVFPTISHPDSSRPDSMRELKLGVQIPKDFQVNSGFLTLVRALKSWDESFKIKVYLLFRDDWKLLESYQELMQILHKENLADIFVFNSDTEIKRHYEGIDVYLNIFESSDISYEDIFMIGCSVPIVLPRGEGRHHLLIRIGLDTSYQLGDAKSLRDVLKKVFNNYSKYLKLCQEYKYQITDEHQASKYFGLLTTEYNKGPRLRERLLKSRQLFQLK